MNSEKYIKDVYSTLMDEKLLRFLVYNTHDPLTVSSTQPDILSNSNKKVILDQHLIMSAKTSDLTSDSKISRLCMYAGRRTPTRSNYLFSRQDIVFDVYIHEDIDLIDLRLRKICDYLNDLFFNKRITGMSSINFVQGTPIMNAPGGYMGYRLVYEFCSENY